MGVMRHRMKTETEYGAGVEAWHMGISFAFDDVDDQFLLGYYDARDGTVDRTRLRDSDRSGYLY